MGFDWLCLGHMLHSEGRAESEGRLFLSGNQNLIIKMQKNGFWVEKILEWYVIIGLKPLEEKNMC